MWNIETSFFAKYKKILKHIYNPNVVAYYYV